MVVTNANKQVGLPSPSANNSCDGSCGGGCDQCASRQGRQQGTICEKHNSFESAWYDENADASSCQGLCGLATCQGAAPASNTLQQHQWLSCGSRRICQDGSCGGRFSDGSGRRPRGSCPRARDMGFGPIGNGRWTRIRRNNEGSSGLLGIGRGRGAAGCGRGGLWNRWSALRRMRPRTGWRDSSHGTGTLSGDLAARAGPTYAYPYYTTSRDFLQDNTQHWLVVTRPEKLNSKAGCLKMATRFFRFAPCP